MVIATTTSDVPFPLRPLPTFLRLLKKVAVAAPAQAINGRVPGPGKIPIAI